jgi:hypothetical protein
MTPEQLARQLFTDMARSPWDTTHLEVADLVDRLAQIDDAALIRSAHQELQARRDIAGRRVLVAVRNLTSAHDQARRAGRLEDAFPRFNGLAGLPARQPVERHRLAVVNTARGWSVAPLHTVVGLRRLGMVRDTPFCFLPLGDIAREAELDASTVIEALRRVSALCKALADERPLPAVASLNGLRRAQRSPTHPVGSADNSENS